jgi:RND family efflux transporter MFP subunit
MKTHSINMSFALGAIVIASMIAQACTDSNGKGRSIPKASEPVPVKIVKLEKTMGKETIAISGQLTTDDETPLGFKTGGVVHAVLVKEGDRVKKGQLLATLDLTEINAQVAQARHGFEKAQRDFQRVTNLYKDSVATLEQLQNAETGLAVAREQFDAANFNRSFSEIHAPGNGYVLKKFVNAGQVVGVGDPILLTNGAADGNWLLKAGVSDKQWASIKIGNPATLTLDAFPDKSFEAIVTRKSETSDARTGAFSVELKLKHDGINFASGMFASAVLSTGEGVSSWSVPYEAVLDASDDQGFVFVTNDNQTAVKQSVTISSFDGTSIRITKGLENAGALIISGSAYLADGSPINILK